MHKAKYVELRNSIAVRADQAYIATGAGFGRRYFPITVTEACERTQMTRADFIAAMLKASIGR